MQVRIQQIGPGMVQQIQSVCGECQGQGERINAKDRCKKCLGKKVPKDVKHAGLNKLDLVKEVPTSRLILFHFLKVVRDRKVLEVHIDKGMSDGQKITFSGEGDQEPGLEPGDIIILIDEKEHNTFK